MIIKLSKRSNMKVVVCQNCGAKYQLEDDEDLEAFECSICTGNLEELEDYQEINNDTKTNLESNHVHINKDDSVLVYCTHCGLKFRLDNRDNIRDYECISCDGPLRYVDENLNELYRVDERYEDSLVESEYLANVDSESISETEDAGFLTSGTYEKESYDNSVIDDVANVSEESIVSKEVTSKSTENYLDVEIGSEKASDISDFYESSLNSNNFNKNDENLNNTEDNSEKIAISDDSVVGGSVSDDSVVGGFVSDDSVSKDFKEGNIKTNIIGEPVSNDLKPLEPKPITSSEFDDSEAFEIEGDSNSLKSKGELESDSTYEKNSKRVSKPSNGSEDFKLAKDSEDYKLALFKYHSQLKNDLKKDFMVAIDKEIYADDSLGRRWKTITDMVKNFKLSDLTAGPEDRLIPPESIVMADTSELNDVNTSYAYISSEDNNYYVAFIIIGLFVSIITLVYFVLTFQIFVVFFLLAGLVLLGFGIYKKYNISDTETRGKIIREKLLTLPEDFHVFYFVKTPKARFGLNHVVVGPTGIFTILSQKYNSKEDKERVKSDFENVNLIGDSASLEKYRNKKNTLKLSAQNGDKQSRFQLSDVNIKFDYNNRVKQKALSLNEQLAELLEQNGFAGAYIEPLVGFVNNEVAVINVILTNEDLFLDELLYKISHGKRRLDKLTVHKIANLLNKYSAECSQEEF